MFYLIFLPLIIYAQENLDPRLNGIDTLITGILKEWNVPGRAITIVEKNDIIFTKGYGYKKLDKKQPINENTVFPIASCTKAFTAALIGRVACMEIIKISRVACGPQSIPNQVGHKVEGML